MKNSKKTSLSVKVIATVALIALALGTVASVIFAIMEAVKV